MALLPLPKQAVERLQKWLAEPEGALLRTVLEGLETESTLEAGKALVGGREDPAKDEDAREHAAQAHEYRRFLALLDAAAKGYYGDNEQRTFDYVTA